MCSPCLLGWGETATHTRDPTTTLRGQFELLCFQPGPGPGSSDHLVTWCSHLAPMWTQSLVRTPAQHSLPRPVSSQPPAVHFTSPPDTELQDRATSPGMSELGSHTSQVIVGTQVVVPHQRHLYHYFTTTMTTTQHLHSRHKKNQEKKVTKIVTNSACLVISIINYALHIYKTASVQKYTLLLWSGEP